MSLTTDFPPQEVKYELTDDVEWNHECDRNLCFRADANNWGCKECQEQFGTTTRAKGIDWEISPSAKVDPIPDNTISMDFANGYTKGKDDMRAKIEAAIEEFRQIDAANVYKVWGYNEIAAIIRKYIGEAE